MITNIDDLKQRINILDIISHYVPLRKSGGNYSCCCPFHDEKSPSFMVNIQKQMFYCFGCGKGGDAIYFVQEYQKLEFIQAIEEIAGILNFQLEYQQAKENHTESINNALLEYALSNASVIQEYCIQRGFNEEIIQTFQLGYVAESFAIKKCIEVVENGIEISKNLGILYDTNNGLKSMFEKRLLIPIHNNVGKVVGFSGRIIENKRIDNAAQPKYINSKESKIYHKKHILYGFHIAKQHIIETKEVYIVEGYFDVMSLHAMGYKNSVGICGIALSKEHIALLGKYEVAINLALDNDVAGINATKRAILLLLEYEYYNAFVIAINTKQKDFNDILLYDKEAMQSMKKIPIIEFLLQDIYKRLHNTNESIENRAKIAKEAKTLLDSIKDNYIKREYYEFSKKLFGFDIGKLHYKEVKKQDMAQRGHNIILARLIKALFHNKEYQEIALMYVDSSDFLYLEQAFNDCMRGNLTKELASLVMEERYLLPYANRNEFYADIKSVMQAREDRKRGDLFVNG